MYVYVDGYNNGMTFNMIVTKHGTINERWNNEPVSERTLQHRQGKIACPGKREVLEGKCGIFHAG